MCYDDNKTSQFNWRGVVYTTCAIFMNIKRIFNVIESFTLFQLKAEALSNIKTKKACGDRMNIAFAYNICV